jgi:hypothetical protein
MLALVKLLMTAACETSGFFGGVIYPSAFIGAAIGSSINASASVISLGGACDGGHSHSGPLNPQLVIERTHERTSSWPLTPLSIRSLTRRG